MYDQVIPLRVQDLTPPLLNKKSLVDHDQVTPRVVDMKKGVT